MKLQKYKTDIKQCDQLDKESQSFCQSQSMKNI